MRPSLTNTLLVLIGLSSCSIARHGHVSTQNPRINWPPPGRASQQHPGGHTTGRRDGIYSAHNYKQGNPAARRLTEGEGIRVKYPQPGLAHLASYKTPLPGLVPVGGIIINHRLATDLVGRNYKMPRPVTLCGLNGGGVANELKPSKPFESLNRLLPTVTPSIPSPTNPIN